MPGSPLDPRAEGTNGLIKQGVTPVTETADIVSVLQPIMQEKKFPAREPERRTDGRRGRRTGARRARPHIGYSARLRSRSMIWCDCRTVRRRWCGWCCSSLRLPDGWNAMAAAWYRWP